MVFSTPVEVFLRLSGCRQYRVGLLHARGGVSIYPPPEIHGRESSPRPWRCFRVRLAVMQDETVFSTPVEVFLASFIRERSRVGLLHARGGVSGDTTPTVALPVSSPRPWRCFCRSRFLPWRKAVFSTPVEVFLRHCSFISSIVSLLHARGGVSR